MDAVKRKRLEEQLRFNTPFWAGGVTRDGSTGAWVTPGPRDFQGCAKILNKQRKLVPAIAHPWQLEFDDMLERQRSEGKPMRAIILKARKLGFSTWVALKFLQRLTLMEYQQAIVVAQDVKTAGQIFDMAKLAHAHLPTVEELGLGFNIRPDIISQSFSPNGRKFMVFGESGKRLRENGRTGDSIFEIDTAGAPDAGRGYTPSMLHLSEVAWWEAAQAMRKMTGMLNAMPQEPETIVVLESTANGLNHFYKRWVAAREGARDPDTGENYAPLFVPWQRDPNARMPFENDEARERFVLNIGNTGLYGEQADDEPMLQEMYGCTPEQLFWRRMMIRTQHEGNVELFNQENPHSDEAAFIGSGRTVFAGVSIAKAIKAAEAAPQPVKGTLRGKDWRERRSRAGMVRVPESALWVPEDKRASGELVLEVWEHPRKADDQWPEDTPKEERVDGAYIVAVDTAEGEANTFSKGDFHCVQVFDHRTHEQVAIHESRVDVHELPVFVLCVALYYNRAWLMIEANGPGIAVLDPLTKDYRYSRMYRRKKVDRTRNVVEDRPGFKTDQVTKHVIESTFAQALQDETHGLRDIKTARQLSTYIINEKGKHEAQQGEHDDRLMAAMIAHRGMEELRPPKAGKRRRTDFVARDDITGY